MARKSTVALVFFAALLAPLWAGASSVYVKSAKAKVLQAPKFDAPLVAEVERGQELSLLDRGDRWFKVKHGGKEGWVPELLVSEEPLKSGKASLLDNAGDDISGKSRRRASAIATAGASRGLSAKGMREMYTEDGKKANWAALDKVESTSIDPAEAVKFINQGLSGAKGGVR